MSQPVTVVGAGVVGLTCAVALREAGFDARVIARDEPLVSEVAGGLWQPYATGEDERTLRWARETYHWLAGLGHPLVDLIQLEEGLPAWACVLPPGSARAARQDELPAGRGPGWVIRVPLVPMPRHLADLRRRAGGVRVADVPSLESLGGLVVNCTGLAAARLTGDDRLVPIRGQVVHVAHRAEVPCIVDEAEVTYVLPRGDVCVLGGFSQAGDDDPRPREHETADILARCTRLVPALAGAEVVRVLAGVRPGRRGGARIEREGDVVHCYGHGGAGLTLSWGCAQEVVRLVRGAQLAG